MASYMAPATQTLGRSLTSSGTKVLVACCGESSCQSRIDWRGADVLILYQDVLLHIMEYVDDVFHLPKVVLRPPKVLKGCDARGQQDQLKLWQFRVSGRISSR